MKDQKYREMYAKREEMVKWSKAAEDAVCAKMESVRLSRNYSQPDFSELLDMASLVSYQNMIVRRRAKLTLDTYLRFSYLFGYDLRSATALAPKQTEMDRAVYELAALLSSCSYEGLNELANKTYSVSTIPPETRRKLALAMRELARIQAREEEGEEEKNDEQQPE